jgi:hypothetical protein
MYVGYATKTGAGILVYQPAASSVNSLYTVKTFSSSTNVTNLTVIEYNN